MTKSIFRHIDPQTAPRLMNGWEMRYLGPFLGREATLSQAAAELGVSVSRLQYQVRRLLAEGLLQVSRLERRGRRELKVYRAVAEVVFVPFERMSSATVEAALARADQPWLDLFLRALGQIWYEHPGEWGMRLEGDGRGGVCASVVARPDGARSLLDAELPAVLTGGWITDLRLDFHEAKALQRELSEVMSRYEGKSGSERYLLQVRLSPLLKDARDVPQVSLR